MIPLSLTDGGPGAQRPLLPRAIGLRPLAAVVAGLLLLQLASGTDPVFALLVSVFVILTGVTFNVSGGLTTVTGLGITAVAVKTVIFSQLVKIAFWQPADSYLEAPLHTMAVLDIGLASMLLGIMAAGPRIRRPWLPSITQPEMLKRGAVVCAIIGGVSALLVARSGIDTNAEQVATGGILRFAHLFVRALPLSIVFATAYTIEKSKYQRSVSLGVMLTLGAALGYAAVSGTKQGVFETVLYYVLTCLAWRYPLRRKHFAVLGTCAVVGILVVWPVLQALKSVTVLTSVTLSERVELIGEALAEIKSVDDFAETRDDVNQLMSNERFEYYGRPSGWLERFSLIEQNDELVLATLQQGELGWYTIQHALRALVPSYIDPDKPTKDTGNLLGKRIGFLSEQDDETQVAFGLVAESFAAMSWLGVIVFPALFMFLFVHLFGRLTGNIWCNVWAIYLFGRLQHTFVEQSIASFLREMIMLPFVLGTLAFLIREVGTRLTAREQPDADAGAPSPGSTVLPVKSPPRVP